MSNHVPEYDVIVTDELNLFIEEWPQERQEQFLILASQLGKTCITQDIRQIGGKMTWIPVGSFHITCTYDHITEIITVTDGVPCTHTTNECHSHPRSPYYTSGFTSNI